MDAEPRLSLSEYERLTRPSDPRLSLEQVKKAIESRPESLALLVHIVKLCVQREVSGRKGLERVIRRAIKQASKEATDLYPDCIPNAITNLRILRDETQWQMAPILEMDQSTLARYESGTRNVSSDSLKKLAQLAKDTPGGEYLASAFDLKCENLEP